MSYGLKKNTKENNQSMDIKPVYLYILPNLMNRNYLKEILQKR